jgi:hypothetical protein
VPAALNSLKAFEYSGETTRAPVVETPPNCCMLQRCGGVAENTWRDGGGGTMLNLR